MGKKADRTLGGVVSDSVIREHVGNGVPVATATGIGSTFLNTLLLAKLGLTNRVQAAILVHEAGLQ